MKGFYWGTGVIRCGFCGKPHHNITTCKAVDDRAAQALTKMENDPSYICDHWEHFALIEIKKRAERKAKLKKKKRAPRCSYCKSVDHKRPRCDSLKELKKKVYKANKNLKKAFATRANEVGVGVGSLLEFDTRTAYNFDLAADSHKIFMITQYDLASLNIFCALDINSQYQSNSTVDILCGDKSDRLSVKYFGQIFSYDLLHQGWWYSQGSPKVLSRMPWVPDKAWLEGEWDEIFNWFFKEVNHLDLINSGVMRFIDKWANKN